MHLVLLIYIYILRLLNVAINLSLEMADSLSHPETHASECISVYIGAPMGYSFSGQTLLIDSKGT